MEITQGRFLSTAPRRRTARRGQQAGFFLALMFVLLAIAAQPAKASEHTTWVWTCNNQRGAAQPVGSSLYTPTCSTPGSWQLIKWVDDPAEDHDIPEQFDAPLTLEEIAQLVSAMFLVLGTAWGIKQIVIFVRNKG